MRQRGAQTDNHYGSHGRDPHILGYSCGRKSQALFRTAQLASVLVTQRAARAVLSGIRLNDDIHRRVCSPMSLEHTRHPCNAVAELNHSVSGVGRPAGCTGGTCEDFAAEDFAIHRLHPSAVIFAGAGRQKDAMTTAKAMRTALSLSSRSSRRSLVGETAMRIVAIRTDKLSRAVTRAS
jgi:hypothetical protein